MDLIRHQGRNEQGVNSLTLPIKHSGWGALCAQGPPVLFSAACLLSTRSQAAGTRGVEGADRQTRVAAGAILASQSAHRRAEDVISAPDSCGHGSNQLPE